VRRELGGRQELRAGDYLLDLGFLDEPFQRPARRDGCEIEQRTGGRRDPETVLDHHVARGKGAGTVGPDPGPLSGEAAFERDVDDEGLRAQLVQRGGAPVAEDGARPRGQECRLRYAGDTELFPGDDAVLLPGGAGDRRFRRHIRPSPGALRALRGTDSWVRRIGPDPAPYGDL
jgi:hypothetical protein